MDLVPSPYLKPFFMQIRFEMWLSELDINSNVKQFIMQKYITKKKYFSITKNTRFTASPVVEV